MLRSYYHKYYKADCLHVNTSQISVVDIRHNAIKMIAHFLEMGAVSEDFLVESIYVQHWPGYTLCSTVCKVPQI
jgi:gamma-glutamyl-gamma-aminobutyrate hydrolase PuuD